MAYFHKILDNPKGLTNHFDGSRGFDNDPEEEEEPHTKDYEYQKGVLSKALDRLETAAALKYERRIMAVPASIDYIRIDFLITFDNNDPEYKTKERFIRDFGLSPIRYYNFNKSVLFEINDHEKFNLFHGLVTQYVNSSPYQSPSGKSYSIITIISEFTFLSREAILQPEEITDTENYVVLELTKQDDSSLENDKLKIFTAMNTFLNSEFIEPQIASKYSNTQFLSLSGISRTTLIQILDHFDIIASVQAIHIPRIKTLSNGTLLRTFDFHISAAGDHLPKVAIIDNGVNKIPPLIDSLATNGYTFDPTYPPYNSPGWHGTAVAVLAAVGESFFNKQVLLKPDCRIVSYRIFENQGGQINMQHFEQTIRDAYSKGIRLFNLSANTRFKSYNSDYSYFGYLLDKLSYELDILFFISAGNLDPLDLENIYTAIQGTVPYHDMLDYPKHFFYPDTYCDEHSCDGTNLKEPADSLNNLTIGAIAENFEQRSKPDLTLDKTLPAYYTSKYHVSPYHKVNGTRLKSKHINYRMVKPDIVYPGGDYGAETAGMQLVGSGIGNDLFRLECGTSFSAPFATNLAAKLTTLYPSLTTQSIKAIIINSAVEPADSEFLKPHLNQLKEHFSSSEFGKTYAGLNLSEKLKVNKWFHDKDLLFKLIGHGVPNRELALSSNRKSITVIIQDQIKTDTHKAIPINLPAYLNSFTKKSPIVSVQATLVFKFQPNFKDQTGYNPLHISFNFIKTFSDRQHFATDQDHTANIAAYRDGIPFYNRLYQGISDTPQKTVVRNEALGIKGKIGTWSDDFYPNGRQFSNSQKMNLLINVTDLNKISNNLSLIVRCIGKKETGFDTSSYLAGNHPYSIVLTFSERPNREFSEYDFYNEFSRINQTLDIVAQTELDTDLEAEAGD